MNKKEVTTRYLEIRGCKIKRTYQNRKEAKIVAKRLNRNSDSGRVRAYSCDFCPDYHVGHIRPSHEDRIQDKNIEKILKNAI